MDRRIVEMIQERLLKLEGEHSIKILYAVESGSRAWGLESVDSDYDVRFIYAHNKNWYLNILPKKDVIECPINDKFDFSGWDLRKTLLLLNKSNPALFEWLESPIMYCKDDYFYSIIKELSKKYFSPTSTVHHYLHMAKGNYRQYLQDGSAEIKKYFYVLRPILACIWIENHHGPPPMEFEKLLAQVQDKALLEQINELVMRKKSGMEEQNVPDLNKFIGNMLIHIEGAIKTLAPKEKPNLDALEEGFIKVLDYIEDAHFASLGPI